jgi:putative transposase
MSDYRRAYDQGGCYFFTVVTYDRRPWLTQPDIYQRLRQAFRHVAATRPFHFDAIVVLPDHMHCIWQLPETDSDFSTRWRLIKNFVSRGAKTVLSDRGEKYVWQRRFWEHQIRDERDWRRHMDYIFFNPVKHGYVSRPADWKFSSFAYAVAKGWYEVSWGAGEPESIRGLDWE